MAPALAAPAKPDPAPFIVTANVPAVPEARNVPEADDRNTFAEVVRVGLVSTLTAPEAERATVASVAVFVLLALISADALVAPVGVWEACSLVDQTCRDESVRGRAGAKQRPEVLL